MHEARQVLQITNKAADIAHELRLLENMKFQMRKEMEQKQRATKKAQRNYREALARAATVKMRRDIASARCVASGAPCRTILFSPTFSLPRLCRAALKSAPGRMNECLLCHDLLTMISTHAPGAATFDCFTARAPRYRGYGAPMMLLEQVDHYIGNAFSGGAASTRPTLPAARPTRESEGMATVVRKSSKPQTYLAQVVTFELKHGAFVAPLRLCHP